MNDGKHDLLRTNSSLRTVAEAETGDLKRFRRVALEKFETLSWPTPAEEEWRRSDVSKLDLDGYLDHERGATESRSEEEPAAAKTAETKLNGTWSGVIMFAGGKLVSAELDPELKAKGVIFSSYAEELVHGNGILAKTEAVFAKSVSRIDNRIQALHYGAWDHGAVLYVPPFVEIKTPFYVDFLETGKHDHTAPHLLVYLDTGARASVVQRLRGAERDEVLCNAGYDAMVEESAGLNLTAVQTLGKKATFFNHGNVTVKRNGTYDGFEAILGSSFSKTRVESILDGEGSDVHLRGIYLADGNRHMDIRTVQRHLAPKANSRSFYKGAVKDAGRSVYQGLIEVAPNASRTDAYLTNRNLILTDGARADSIPSLQIKTNDVKCSHGSTTGRIDPEQRFYLQARGLSRKEADRLLVTGFFEDVFRTAPEAIHEPLRKIIAKRID